MHCNFNKIRIDLSLPMGFTITEDSVIPNGRVNEAGDVKCLNIDQSAGQGFMRNECGFLMSDVQAYELAESSSVAETILRRIKQTAAIGDEVDTRPFDEICQDLIPANYGSPAEFLRYSRQQAEREYNRLRAKQEEYLTRMAAKDSTVTSDEKLDSKDSK